MVTRSSRWQSCSVNSSFALRSFLGIMPPKSYPNVPSIIEANDILQSAHTAHARSTGVKNCG